MCAFLLWANLANVRCVYLHSMDITSMYTHRYANTDKDIGIYIYIDRDTDSIDIDIMWVH